MHEVFWYTGAQDDGLLVPLSHLPVGVQEFVRDPLIWMKALGTLGILFVEGGLAECSTWDQMVTILLMAL